MAAIPVIGQGPVLGTEDVGYTLAFVAQEQTVLKLCMVLEPLKLIVVLVGGPRKGGARAGVPPGTSADNQNLCVPSVL